MRTNASTICLHLTSPAREDGDGRFSACQLKKSIGMITSIISDNWIMRISTVLVHVVGCNCTSMSTVDDKQKNGAKIYCGWQLWVRRNFWQVWVQKLVWRQMTYQRVASFLTLASCFWFFVFSFFQHWWCTQVECLVAVTDPVHISTPVWLIHEGGDVRWKSNGINSFGITL